jgi:hypothetical protein
MLILSQKWWAGVLHVLSERTAAAEVSLEVAAGMLPGGDGSN